MSYQPTHRTAPAVFKRLRFAVVGMAIAAVGFAGAMTGVHADTSLPNWGLQHPVQAPAPRAYAAMDYDSARGRTVLFGGGSNPSTTFTDTWEWDGSNWSTFLTFPSPPGAIGPGMAYDSARGVSVLFGGSNSLNDTWEWNGSVWARRTFATAPSPRVWTAMAYDSARSRIVLFGGEATGGVDQGDTWTYDGSTWTKMSPASSPTPRFGMAMAYDSARGVTVLFGGRSAGQRLADTWEWDGTNWTQRTPATSPYPRFWHSMAYSTQLGETVMFGGDHIQPFTLGPINDTWLWDGTNWTRDWTAAAPSYRAGHSMAYDAARGRSVLFGGEDEGFPGVFYNDTWELGSGIVTPAGNPATFFNPASINFGTTTVGTTSPISSVFILSAGTGPLVFSSIATSGDFAVSTSDCPIAPNPLAAGAYCRVGITFTPTVCTLRSGSLTFTDNGPGGAQSLPLQGTGSLPGCDADLQLIAPADVTVNATSPAGAVVNYGGPIVLDEDSTPVVSCDHPSGSTFPIGTTTVTCSGTDIDDSDGTVTATFHVTVRDTDLGLAAMPANISVSATSPAGAAVTFTAPSALDEDASTPPVSCSPASGSTFPIGTTTVTCQVSDADDSPSTIAATFAVTVLDTDLALAGTPADISVSATSQAGATVIYTAPSALDEDAIAPPVTCSPASGSTFPVGTTTVSCQVSDADDSPSTIASAFQVTVLDADLGLTGVPADITVDASGPTGAVVTYVAPGATDEDGSAPVVSCDHASGSTFPIGTTTVTCTASDGDDSPGTITAGFHVIVNDTDLGFSGLPGNITVDAAGPSGAVVSYLAPTAVDEDASLPAVSCDHASGSTFPIGTTVVTCHVSDPDDSPSTIAASFQVTVRDTDLALTGVPTDLTVIATGSSGAAVKFAPPTAVDEDANAPAVSCDHNPATTFPVGTTLVTCRATDLDDAPSTVTSTFHVTVTADIQLALSVSPTSATAHTTVTTTAAVTNLGVVSRKATISYSVTFTDSSGKTSTVASDKAAVTLGAGQVISRSFSFDVKSSTVHGAYVVTVVVSDVTGSVTQSRSFTVT
jgi:hypothetical protein